MSRKLTSVFLSILLLSMLFGCQEPAPKAPDRLKAGAGKAKSGALVPGAGDETDMEPGRATILLAAAASLENAFKNDLIPLFESRHPSITVEGTYDSSGKLQAQIREGLGADVFMSAAAKQLDELIGEQMVDGDSVVNLLENRIVMIAPVSSNIGIDSFYDIAKAPSIALGDPESVPAGQYAREALTNLGVWDEAASRASFGTNVTEVLAWVAEGSADVGIVYKTDAASSDKVRILAEAPEGSLKTRVIYPLGIVSSSLNKAAAKTLIEFLKSPEAIAVFEKYGFMSAMP